MAAFVVAAVSLLIDENDDDASCADSLPIMILGLSAPSFFVLLDVMAVVLHMCNFDVS